MISLHILVCFNVLVASFVAAAPSENREYLIVGVSGGLQDGFPEHHKLDYHSGESDESRAIFLGRALVRGYKAFLDVMQEGWRQYSPEPMQPLINCNVFASGCYEHANEYWIYLVDSRQLLSALNHEPRFLSITPDTGQIDLDADATFPAVKAFLGREIEKQGKTDMLHVAVPLVTAVWFHESHVPSPIIRTLDDGTQVTNFPDSLALWANVSDSDRTAKAEAMCSSGTPDEQVCTAEILAEAEAAYMRYWDGIRKAIRAAEAKVQSPDHGPPFKCKKKVRFGVGVDTARVNYPMSASEVETALRDIGFNVDFIEGEMHPIVLEE